MKRHGRTERALLRLMTMNVHPIVYLCIAISVWHSAVTVFNGFYLPDNHSLVFLNNDAFNIIIGNVGVICGLALTISLRYNRWESSSWLSLINLSAWTGTTAMLVSSGAWGGVIMCTFYAILYVYVALASAIHNTYGFQSTKSPRQEFYENQK